MIDTAGSIDFTALGNDNSTSLSGGGPFFDDVFDSGLLGEGDGTLYDGHTSDVSQGNDGSPQDSSVNGSSVSSDVSNVDAGGGVTDVALNSTMSNDGSPQNASVTDSEACRAYESAAPGAN